MVTTCKQTNVVYFVQVDALPVTGQAITMCPVEQCTCEIMFEMFCENVFIVKHFMFQSHS